jgi:two-component system, OmpR family, sensor kinase
MTSPVIAVRGRLHAMSLRARLVAVVTGLLVLALVVTGSVTLAVLQKVLSGQVDSDLRAITSSTSTINAIRASSQTPTEEHLPSDYVVQTLDADGQVVGSPRMPPNHADDLPSLRDLTAAEVVGRHLAPFTVRTGDGEDWRVIAVPVTFTAGPLTGSPGSVAVARPLEGVHKSVARVAGALLLVGLLVVLAGALLGSVAVRRAFRPLRDVEAVTAAFGDGDTSRRVAVSAPGTEVGRLGGAVNAMLDRIETSLAAREASESRMRRFVADASHELRTPLAAVRGFAELYRMGAVRKPEDVGTAFDRIEHEATRMGGLVEDLLLLARLDEQRPMRHDPVDLLLLAADAGHDARALAPDRTVRVTGVDGAPPGPAPVVGDEARLRQVLTNLVANALRHTPAGTPVELGVGVRDRWAVWQVVDHGPGIAPEDAERVFERFWRADSSRQRGSGGGAGLGMAIVAAIVHTHAGAVRVVPTPGGGATIEVALPLAGAGVPAAPDLPEAPDPQARDGGGPEPEGPEAEGPDAEVPEALGVRSPRS